MTNNNFFAIERLHDNDWETIILNIDKYKWIKITASIIASPGEPCREDELMWGVYLTEEGKAPIELAKYYSGAIAKWAASGIRRELTRALNCNTYDMHDLDYENSYYYNHSDERKEQERKKEEERIEKRIEEEVARRVEEIAKTNPSAA